MEIRTVVAATDLSEASLIALETALNLNLGGEATIYLVHVIELPTGIDPMGALVSSVDELEADLSRQLDALVPANLEKQARIEKVVITGTPASAIAGFARERDADMIIVGTHGRSGLARVLMGSTAEALLRQAPCMVLVAKHKEHQQKKQ